ncbi:unnamed protein product [Trifolium pratense]|uniref:Uncharacterized protein n=1 Tax=Trifolium pratense TaxID=57577 RepID=A0ACB0LRY8_TRIPR|nr:unnamed protein product [Trifolium pratense]
MFVRVFKSSTPTLTRLRVCLVWRLEAQAHAQFWFCRGFLEATEQSFCVDIENYLGFRLMHVQLMQNQTYD